MSDSEMTDLADQLNDLEVPLTAQSKAQRKRQEEVTSLLGTDMSGLAEQLMVADLAPDHVPSPKSLEMKRLDRHLPPSEYEQLCHSMYPKYVSHHSPSSGSNHHKGLVTPPSPLSPLALRLWISDDENNGVDNFTRSTDEETAFSNIALRESEEARAAW